MLTKKQNRSFFSSIELQHILILLSSISLIIFSDYIFRGSLFKTSLWLFSNPISAFLTWFIVLNIIYLLTSIFNNYRIGISSASILIILFSIINRIKYDFRGIPFIPEDLYLNNEILIILNVLLDSGIIKLMLLSFISISFMTFLIMNLPKFKLKNKNRFFLLIISIIFLFSIIKTNLLHQIPLKEKSINCLENGFILFFVSNINNNQINLPLEYIVNDLKTLKINKGNNVRSNSVKPNIIIIMSEAFWDINKIKEIGFSKDPTPTINRLKPKSIYGYLESPIFGGGTANTEFELLTGNSTHFYNPGYMVYPNQIKKPIISLSSILKKQEYNCKAIHPFKNWYWNRREVYKYMGFDEYISEEYLINPKYKGFFISDEYVTDLIINEIDRADDPLFIFAVTMQNHGPFNDNRYKNYPKDIEVLGKVSPESLQILQTYTQGIYDADKALGKLVDYCSNASKPTIILFLGDHLPALGKDYKVYREMGYLSENNIDHTNKINLTSVPFILWSNYKTESKDLGLLNLSFIGPYLLEYSGLDMPNYFKFLQHFSKEIPVISRSYAIDKKGNIISSNNERYISYNDDYMLVQQNILYDDKVFEDNYSSWIVEKNQNYNLNLHKITIDEVILEGDETIIRGDNFYPNSLLFIDNRRYKFEYINKKEIRIKNYLLKSSSRLQMKLFDSKNNLLAKSNNYIY